LIRRALFLLAASVAAAVIVVGCGDSGDDDGAATATPGATERPASAGDEATGGGDESESGDAESAAPLTKAVFLKRGNAICSRTAKGLNKAVNAYSASNKAKGGANEAEQQARAFAVVLYPSMEKMADEIEALPAPTGDADEVDAYIAALRESIAAEQPESLLGIARQFVVPEELATDYGLAACALL
jgi:hypothetical protein